MILGKFSLYFLQGHPDHSQNGDDQGSKGHSAQVVSQGAMQGAGEAWRAGGMCNKRAKNSASKKRKNEKRVKNKNRR